MPGDGCGATDPACATRRLMQRDGMWDASCPHTHCTRSKRMQHMLGCARGSQAGRQVLHSTVLPCTPRAAPHSMPAYCHAMCLCSQLTNLICPATGRPATAPRAGRSPTRHRTTSVPTSPTRHTVNYSSTSTAQLVAAATSPRSAPACHARYSSPPAPTSRSAASASHATAFSNGALAGKMPWLPTSTKSPARGPYSPAGAGGSLRRSSGSGSGTGSSSRGVSPSGSRRLEARELQESVTRLHSEAERIRWVCGCS